MVAPGALSAHEAPLGSKISAYIAGHRSAILASQVLAAFAAAFFLWFVGHLRHVLERAEGGVEALSPLVTISGTALAALGVLSVVPYSVLALMAVQPEGLKDASLVRMLSDMNQVLGGGVLGVAGAVSSRPPGSRWSARNSSSHHWAGCSLRLVPLTRSARWAP